MDVQRYHLYAAGILILLYALFFLYVHVDVFPDISRFDSFQPTGLEDMRDARYEPSIAVSHVYTVHG